MLAQMVKNAGSSESLCGVIVLACVAGAAVLSGTGHPVPTWFAGLAAAALAAGFGHAAVKTVKNAATSSQVATPVQSPSEAVSSDPGRSEAVSPATPAVVPSATSTWPAQS